MLKIDLTVYKETKYYFYLFDIIIRDAKVKKEPFLRQIGISPSSYRKSRSVERNAGDKIIEQLCEYFGYTQPDCEVVCSIEELLNKIYSNVYYKIYTSYKEDLEYVNKLLDKNYIFHPVLKVIKLFILANSNIDVDVFVNENRYLYDELQNYLSFFTDDLLEILDILSLLFEEQVKDVMIHRNYKNNLVYYSLATSLWNEERYVECLFIVQKAEDKLVKEQNYRRLVSLNVIKIFCLNAIGNYKEGFELASGMLLTIKSFIGVDYELKYIASHLALCSLALKKYEYCLEILLNKEKVSFTDICTILIAKYFINKEEYKTTYNYYYGLLGDEDKMILKWVDSYIKNKNKKSLSNLNHPKLIRYFINVIRDVIE